MFSLPSTLGPVFLLVVSPSHRLCASSRCAPASSSSLRFFPSSLLLCLFPFPVVKWKQIHTVVAPTILRLCLSSYAEVSLFLESSVFFLRLSSIQLALFLSFPFVFPLFPFRTNRSLSPFILSESFFFLQGDSNLIIHFLIKFLIMKFLILTFL